MRPALIALLALVLAACGGDGGEDAEADDCPGYAGVSHATARIEAEREATAREKELEIELKFVKLDRGSGEGGKPAWEAVYEDTTGEYPDLCVWVQTDPKGKDKNLITSDDCA